MYRDISNIVQLKYEAAWCNTFSCLETSQTRDSAGFQSFPSDVSFVSVVPVEFQRARWLIREITDRSLNPSPAARLFLSSLEQPGNLLALLLPSGGMAARHKKNVKAELTVIHSNKAFNQFCDLLASQPSLFVIGSVTCMSVPGSRWLRWLEHQFTDRKVRVSHPTFASRLPLSRLGQPGNIPALLLPSGGMAARHQKG
ncbi:hypothetical protein CSKR_107817 [Clonorchis sinensis]|uniref:Uncharacterized protein n=1 Tax=Clonorchis sinensis TaxID=79923 RepID=A0A419PIL5_CLOSI|nr:hypothetical protein CSKR_107817 [Clonorchis sinensis]